MAGPGWNQSHLFTVIGVAAFLGAGLLASDAAELMMDNSSVTTYQHGEVTNRDLWNGKLCGAPSPWRYGDRETVTSLAGLLQKPESWNAGWRARQGAGYGRGFRCLGMKLAYAAAWGRSAVRN